jgi:hypothetical protein
MAEKTIGGFFPLLSGVSFRRHRRNGGDIFLTSGRSSLAYVLERVRPARIHLPFYLCGEVHDFVTEQRVEVVYYAINRALEPEPVPRVRKGDLIYVVNYFGMMTRKMIELSTQFGSQLVVDNTHDFFSNPPAGSWAFTNVRKTVGLPDGSFLSGPDSLGREGLPDSPVEILHNIVRLFGPSPLALDLFRRSELKVSVFPAKGSKLSRRLVPNIKSELISRRRVDNFGALHRTIGGLNSIDLSVEGNVPFCYPLVPKRPLNREALISEGFFVPQFWAGLDRISGIPDWEVELARKLLPLPIDHRYTEGDMLRMSKRVRALVEK